MEPIWNRARSDLVLSREHGGPDFFLWEHSTRITRSALLIARLPELAHRRPDESAVTAAGLYHEAGWVVQVKSREMSSFEVLAKNPPENHREFGARFMEQRLSALMSPESIERASIAIRTLNDREISSLEGQIVTEAENLNEFGTVSLWATVRRNAAEGKGIRAALDTWHRRREYHFWEAKLNDAFRFAPVREIAQSRLERFELIMQELEEQHECADLRAHVEDVSASPS